MIAAIAAGVIGSVHVGDGIGFVGFVPTDVDWSYSTAVTATKIYEIEAIDPGFDWNELVVSWNVDGGHGVGFEAKVKVLGEHGDSPMYSFGKWALGTGRRESVKNQKDVWGRVDTDTLILARPARKLELQLILTRPQRDPKTRVRYVGLSFRNTAAPLLKDEPNKAAWGRTIEVPQRSQMSYEGGKVWCSPTCVSMMLSHWSRQLGRSELDRDVPEVVANVMDPNWPGTGNWPFNTAYAGSFEGLRGYVARFAGITELEDWIVEGVPVVTSVSSAMLKGKPEKEPNDGHLVIVVGFTKDGDPVFNDPGRSKEIRQVYKRADFERAWRSSGNTVYLIYPEAKAPPKNRLGHWGE